MHRQLEKLGVEIQLNTKVAKAEKHKLYTADNAIIEADLMVWAAGVKAPDFLKDVGGLLLSTAFLNDIKHTRSICGRGFLA